MSTAARCIACGGDLTAAGACKSCGKLSHVQCTHCGARMPHGSRYCSSCGTNLGRQLAMAFGSGATAAPRLPAHLAQRILASQATIEGERRRVTILFADIKGSTGLIEGLDPEAAEALLGQPLRRMIDAVHRYDGTVNRIQGDGIMALFGAPIAQEDNAARAVYAALDMQAAVRSLSSEQLAIRVGLHCGEVVVRAVNNDFSFEYDAVGASVHLAARMEQMAAPGAIYCTHEVAQQTEGLIRFKSLGPLSIKGFREPREVIEILGLTNARTRWDVSSARGLTPFINRAEEMASLRELLQGANEGRFQAVTVVGDPGVGKSRIVHEFLGIAELRNWTVFRASAAAYRKNTAYLVIGSLLRAWFQIAETDSSATAKDRVRREVQTSDESSLPSLPAIYSLLDLHFDDADWQRLEASERRHQIVGALKRIAREAAVRGPTVLFVEDMQWVDDGSQSLLKDLIVSDIQGPILLLMTCRRDYQHLPKSDARHRVVTIDTLDADTAGVFVRALLGDNPKLEPVRSLIISRTEGTPLFIEETVRSVVEVGDLSDGLLSELDEGPKALKIPPTVQEVIAARIDRLAPEHKALLQAASIVGEEITPGLLQAITDLPGQVLVGLLADLERADFVNQDHTASSERFVFRHALTHEVAYSSLLYSTRQALHARLVSAIEDQYRDRLEEHIDKLAHHAVHGELWSKAINYLRLAGNKALERSAYTAARIPFEQAIAILEKQPRTPENAKLGIDIRLMMRAIFGATGDYDRLDRYLLEAEALAESIGDSLRLAQVNVAKALTSNFRGDLDASIQCGVRARDLAGNIGNHTVSLAATVYIGQARMWRGDFKQAVDLLDGNSWTKGALRHERIITTGTTSVLWLGMLGASAAYLGDFARAALICKEACGIADEGRRPYDVALAYWYAGFVASHQGDVCKALIALEHAWGVCNSNQVYSLVPILGTTLGYTYALSSRKADGIKHLEQAVGFSCKANFAYAEAWSTTYRGFANAVAGQYAHTFKDANRALELARNHKFRAVEAAALRLLGEYYLHGATRDAIVAEVQYALGSEIASELGLRPELAHCLRGLAEARFTLGRSGEAQIALERSRKLCNEMGLREVPR